MKYAAFLRAINVGGHVVKMDRLRTLFEAAGFRGVETVIASGNVVFESSRKSAGDLERAIETHLKKALGYPVATFVRSMPELAAIAELEPFGRESLDSRRRFRLRRISADALSARTRGGSSRRCPTMSIR